MNSGRIEPGGPAIRFAVAAAPIVSLPIVGAIERFPIHRVYCIGRNYADHAVEMGHDPNREPPFFFLKQPDNVTSLGTFPYPPLSADVHHEVEMTVALARGGRDIATEAALDHVFGYGIGLDMTRRDLQEDAKKLSRPWEVGKAFEYSAPCSALTSAEVSGHIESGEICLEINGSVRQKGDINQMIWKVPEIISILSRYFELQPGDLIMTGTPAGVGPVSRGDRLSAKVDGLGAFDVSVF